MRKARISRKGEFRGDNKATSVCIGAHGAGNNSQCDCILFLYEDNNSN